MTEKRVVVGVDDTAGSRFALRWALKEARYRDATVHAVAGWHWDGYDESLWMASGPQVARERTQETLDEVVEKVLAEWVNEPPPVRREVAQGRPDEVLVAAAEGAEMLVVGSHGHGRLRHAALGSVSESCTRHATCPVVVVPLPHH